MFGEKVLHDIEINGYEFLWVNDVLIIDVDTLHFTNNFMFMTNKNNNIVGKIHRNNIKKLIVENYEEEFETDLIDNLILLFDVREVGD